LVIAAEAALTRTSMVVPTRFGYDYGRKYSLCSSIEQCRRGKHPENRWNRCDNVNNRRISDRPQPVLWFRI